MAVSEGLVLMVSFGALIVAILSFHHKKIIHP
ncbi:putative holin-like toxin [Bhargavaea massiliensis]